MRRAYILLGVLLAALLLAVFATTPPGARGVTASAATEFSSARAMLDVRQIASSPHPTGSAENARVRGYIAGRMAMLGMEVSTQQGLVGPRGTAKLNRWTGRSDPPPVLTNVIGVLPGTDRSLPAVLLMAHHDTVWGSPGAADDTTGIAVSLEVVRALRERGPQKRDLIVLATDAEELGLEGAKLFFAEHPLRQNVGTVINMEARGGGGRTTLFQTSAQNGDAVALYADAVARPGASSLSAYVYSVLPNDTDLTPVLAGPYTAYNFAFIGRSGLYHSPKATPERLDRGSVQDMGGQVLDLAAALLAAMQMPGRAPDRVFFDLFGLTTITYPVWLGWACWRWVRAAAWRHCAAAPCARSAAGRDGQWRFCWVQVR
ncbi:MAG TPA: M20/M25/M40 family metallo-hydrolase [Novosphingobium sp.]|nr:M20/M25/M40 family metallo-hydrolase [Novosphingobium sp.]